MNKDKIKKIIGIVGTVITVIAVVLCLISLFISEDSIKTSLVKAASVLTMFVVIVLGILTRIYQVKDIAGTVKKVHGEVKKSAQSSKRDADGYIDPATGALKKTEEPVKEISQVPSSYNAAR